MFGSIMSLSDLPIYVILRQDASDQIKMEGSEAYEDFRFQGPLSKIRPTTGPRACLI